MHKKVSKAIVASLMAVTMMAPVAANVVPMAASAGQVLGESTFDYKALPWHTCESSPAKQDFEITADKDVHLTIKVAKGADGEKWDLQFRHRNLNFKSGHTYKVSFDAKASRSGLELCGKIGNIKGDEEYFVVNGTQMQQGPHMGGQWGKAMTLSTSYQTCSGTFTPTKDLEGVEWAFHYANGTQYEGNAQDNDEIWFDNMSIECTTCSECDADPTNSYGAVNRYYGAQKNPDQGLVGGKVVNFISVNQIGYYSNLAKTATLGDNQGDILHDTAKIDLTANSYEFELIDAKSGTAVYSGTTGAKFFDADSKDNVCKIDFSDFTTPGRYYLKIKGQDWRSFEFNIGDNIYSDSSHDMLTNAINYFYQNRSGIDIEGAYITSGDKSTLAHKGGHKTDTAAVQKIWKNEYASKEEATGTYASSTITANGGWYDAGDHGKYVVNGGISVWTLQNMYERAVLAGSAKFADGSGTVVIPEAGNGIPDILDETMVEIDFMTQMKVKSSEPTWGKYEGMIYHKLHDHKWTGLATRAWDYEEEWGTTRIVKPPTFAATLNYAACAAQAARLLQEYDSSKAKTYLDEAKAAYKAAMAHWYAATDSEEENTTSLYAPLYQAKGGGPYGDTEVRDDAYWAACEIFVSAKIMNDSAADEFYKELSGYKEAFEVTTRCTGGENKGSFTSFNWGNTASAGSITLALHKDLLSADEAAKVEKSLLAAADAYVEEEGKQGYGIPYKYDGDPYNDPNNLDPSIYIMGYEWGSNSMVINNCIVMAYAYDLTNDVKYMNGVATAMNYLLGCNPLSYSFVSGYGTYKLQNPHHRYWSYELDKELPMAPDGVLSGGPNAGLQDPYVRALGFVPGKEGNPSQRCYVDSIEAWSTNEVTINWNAPLAWIASFMQDEAATAGNGGGGNTTTTTTSGTTTTTTTTTSGTTQQPGTVLWGDANCDGTVDIADAVLIMQSQTNPDKYGLQGSDPNHITEQGQINGDVDLSSKGITNGDALKIQQWLLELIPTLDPNA